MTKYDKIQLFILAPSLLYFGFIATMCMVDLWITLWINFSKTKIGEQITFRVEIWTNQFRETIRKMGRSIKEKISVILKKQYVQKNLRYALEKIGLHKRKLQGLDRYKKK